MLDPPLAAPEATSGSPQHPDPLARDLHSLQMGGLGEQCSHERMDRGGSERVRDLLATLFRIRISTAEIQFIGNDFQAGGTYANVVVARLIKRGNGKEEGRKVAVKKFRFIMNNDLTGEKNLRVFVNELCVLDKLSHPNIVKVLGFVENVKESVAWLVFPWEENGNLREFLRSGEWEIPERVSLIRDVALGLEYLHNREPPICHGDLKSLNILVNSANRAVITDFGSARIFREVQNFRLKSGAYLAGLSNRGPPRIDALPHLKVTASDTTLTLTGPTCSLRWAPPEFLNEELLGLASDVWALGWIAWEALTDNYPFEGLNSEWDVTMKIIEGQLPSIYHHDQLSQIHSLCHLMERCWKHGPAERPSAIECQRTLQWIPHAIPSRRGEGSESRSADLILRMGEIHRLQDRHEEASKIYEQGLSIARSTGDQRTVAELLLRVAENDRGRSKYAEAEMSYTQALAIFDILPNDLGRAHALHGLGHVQRLRCKYAEAEASYAQALPIYESLAEDLGRVTTLNALGDLQRARSKHIEAKASYIQALGISSSIGHHLGRAYALLGLGHIQLTRSEYVIAEASFSQALAIYEAMGNRVGRANAILGRGHVQRAQDRCVEAEASCMQALAIYESIGNDLGIANALDNLGYIRTVHGEYVEAEASFTQALVIYERIGDELGRANAYLGLGNLHLARNSHAQAEALYSQALIVYEKIGHAMGRMNCSLELSKIRLRQARYAEAKLLIRNAVMLSEQIDHTWGKVISKKLLDEVLRAERPIKFIW